MADEIVRHTTCTRPGCDQPLAGRKRLYCSPKCGRIMNAKGQYADRRKALRWKHDRAGVVTCLGCGDEFNSPDRISVRFCGYCTIVRESPAYREVRYRCGAPNVVRMVDLFP